MRINERTTNFPTRFGVIGIKFGWAVVILIGVLSLYRERPPAAAPETASTTEFSAVRAMKHVRALARAPHPIGGAAHKETQNYILNELRAAGLDPEVQNTTALINPGGDSPALSANVSNIIARLPGQTPGQSIALSCHYDSVPDSPGASDDGAGVAALLETLRALKAAPRLKNDVIFLFTDAEEVGLLGAIGFVREHSLAKEIKVFLNFEARGTSGPSVMFETSEGNEWLIRQAARAVPQMVTNSLLYQIYRVLPNNTDLTIFKLSGWQGLNFAFAENAVNYHTRNDNVDRIDIRSLQHHGVYALALTRQFGDIEWSAERTGDAVFFSFLGFGLIYYPVKWALPLFLLITLPFFVVIVAAIRRKHLTVGGMLAGAGLVFAACLGASVSVFLAWQAAQILHPHYKSHQLGDVYNSRHYYLSFVFITFSLGIFIVVLTHHRISKMNLAFGALILWWLGLALTSLALPGASYLFAWPLVFALAGDALLLFKRQNKSEHQNRSLALLLGLSPAAMLWTPVIYMLFIALTTSLSAAVMVLLILVLSLLIPFVSPGDWRRKWASSGLSATIAGAFFILGSLTGTQSPQQPSADTVLYCLNADVNQAIWASPDPLPDAWTSQFFRSNLEKGGLPECLPQSARQFIRSQAHAVQTSAPKAELLSDEIMGDIRTARLRLSSPRLAPTLAFILESQTNVLEAWINGKIMPPEIVHTSPTKPRRWILYHYGLPADGLELTLKIKATQSLSFKLVDQSHELPSPAEAPRTPRPDFLMPSMYIFGESTLVAKTYSF